MENQTIHKLRHQLITALQGDATGVHRQAVEGRAIPAGKSLN